MALFLNRAIRVRLAKSIWYYTLMKNCFLRTEASLLIYSTEYFEDWLHDMKFDFQLVQCSIFFIYIRWKKCGSVSADFYWSQLIGILTFFKREYRLWAQCDLIRLNMVLQKCSEILYTSYNILVFTKFLLDWEFRKQSKSGWACCIYFC